MRPAPVHQRGRRRRVVEAELARRIWRLERAQHLARPRADVFAFFADPRNLQRITPPFLRLCIVTPTPIVMQTGALIDYRVRLHGIPLGWRTRISVYEPPVGFVDVQLAGPYRRWEHSHEFHEVEGGTEVRDRVEYEIPLGLLGELAHRAFVRRSLEEIFDYRRDRIAELLAP
jgi:ligand-binding SRPBCC domain-containing protein